MNPLTKRRFQTNSERRVCLVAVFIIGLAIVVGACAGTPRLLGKSKPREIVLAAVRNSAWAQSPVLEVPPGYTQVFKLDLGTMAMERVETTGDGPGWLSGHQAQLVGESAIVVCGGKIVSDKTGADGYTDNDAEFSLCLSTLVWLRQQDEQTEV